MVIGRRTAAAGALLLVGGAVAGAVAIAVSRFPRGLFVLAFVVLAVVLAWYALVRRGAVRAAGVGAAVLLLAGAVALIVFQGPLLGVVAVLGALLLGLAAARTAFTVRAELPAAPAPQHPVLFVNPRSGGGKAARANLATRAQERGIEAVELHPGEDLAALVTAALDRGADALAMAGGDGSQAIVASMAAERGLPYACIPAGTRNHFALDLGVDRDDVVGALDALVDGRERRVDLGEVNGRVFVNNVSLGFYAEAVEREEYRDAKLRTMLDTLPEVLGPEGEALDLRWTGPNGGEHASATAILVSNNRYRLGRAVGSGTRPSMEEGELGITVVEPRHVREWTAPAFEVASEHSVAVGMDGETLLLEPPLRFGIRRRALRVRIADRHPGASPSAAMPPGPIAALGTLARIALGRRPNPRH